MVQRIILEPVHVPVTVPLMNQIHQRIWEVWWIWNNETLM